MPELKLDFARIETLIAGGFLTKRKHPTLGLYILNYTPKTQYVGQWDNETINCRGLVVDGQNNIVARSFPKMFNYEELFLHPEIQAQFNQHLANGDEFFTYEKMDGSLVLVFGYQGEKVVATRGSFDGPQAQRAAEILEAKYPTFDPTEAVGMTFLFEVIYPENRIVVNYGDQEDLYYLTTMGLDGHDIPVIRGYHHDNFAAPFPEPQTHQFNSIEEVTGCWQSTNYEGYVLSFPQSGLRVKFKYEEYKRLHRLLCGITPKKIWVELSEKRSLLPLLDRVPDEFYDWVKKQAGELLLNYYHVSVQCEAEMAAALAQDPGYQWTRKQYAAIFTQSEYPAILFKMLDGQHPAELIWKSVKPSSSGAFRCDG